MRDNTTPSHVETVLRLYPPIYRSGQIECLGNAGGFSGACFWRLTTKTGRFCLRRWPPEHPEQDGLAYIHRVLQHVHDEQLNIVPAPILTESDETFVHVNGCLWELTPWLPGTADFAQRPSETRLQAAMRALAQFHCAAQSLPKNTEFSPPDPLGRQRPDPLGRQRPRRTHSPTLLMRSEQLRRLRDRGVLELSAAIYDGNWPEMACCARRLFPLFAAAAFPIGQRLEAAGRILTSLQPCIRDVWRDHILFTDDDVTGLVDFGAMRQETVAGDVARLLGSLAGDDTSQWQVGLAAYRQIRELSAEELLMVQAFDQSSVLMSPMNWLHWVYVEQRRFEDRDSIVARMLTLLARLDRLVTEGPLQLT